MVKSFSAAYLLSRAGDGAGAGVGDGDTDPGTPGPGARPLGAGTGAIQARLAQVLAQGAAGGLTASALLDAARDDLHSVLAERATGEGERHDGEAHGRGEAAQ